VLKKVMVLLLSILLSAVFISLVACDGYEPEIANHYIEEPANYIDEAVEYEAQDDDLFAVPVVLQILLNGERTTLSGYTIYGRNYFNLSDIAYMLQDTRSHFGFLVSHPTWHDATDVAIFRQGIFDDVNNTAPA